MDFGVARPHEDTMVTQAGAIVGSPVYMSRSRSTARSTKPASDLWSLGVILYEMLAGHAPFSGETIPNVLYQVAHTTPAPLPGAPPAVRLVLDRALDKDPAQRYRSGKEMADAFDAALAVPRPASALLSAAPLPVPQTSGKPATGARPVRRAGIAAVLLALLAAGVYAVLPHRQSAVPKPLSSRAVHRLPLRHTPNAAPSVKTARVVPASPAARQDPLPSSRRRVSPHRLRARRQPNPAPAVVTAAPARLVRQSAPRVRQSAPRVRQSAPRVRQSAPRVQVSVLASPPEAARKTPPAPICWAPGTAAIHATRLRW